MKKVLQGFKKFILRGNVLDLAVGVVIGASFNAVVQSLVKGLITPIIGVFGNLGDFSKLSFSIRGSTFMYGDFLNSLISFILIATCVYFFIVLPVNTLTHRLKKEPDTDPTPPPISPTEKLLTEIRDLLKNTSTTPK